MVMKSRASISIEPYALDVTNGIDFCHELDLEFLRSNKDFAISYDKMIRLLQNKKWTYRLNTRPQM